MKYYASKKIDSSDFIELEDLESLVTKNFYLTLDHDSFAELEEDINLSIRQEMKEEIFFQKIWRACFFLLGLEIKENSFCYASNLDAPQKIAWIYSLTPLIQRVISQVWWIDTASESKSMERLIMPFQMVEELAKGKGKNSFPFPLKKPFLFELSREKFLASRRDFPVTNYNHNPDGHSYPLLLAAVFMEIIYIEERLRDKSISKEEREYLLAILMRLRLSFPFLFPLSFGLKILNFRSPYPYLIGGSILLTYLLYKYKDKLLALFSKTVGVGKQVTIVPSKQVANVLTESQMQLITVLTSFEKQLAIVLGILEKQVDLIPDKNKQLVLVLNILAKQLELVGDKKKQVAIMFGILAKQLVLRTNDIPPVVELPLATGTDLVVYKDKQLSPEVLNFNNDTPLKGEDHF